MKQDIDLGLLVVALLAAAEEVLAERSDEGAAEEQAGPEHNTESDAEPGRKRAAS